MVSWQRYNSKDNLPDIVTTQAFCKKMRHISRPISGTPADPHSTEQEFVTIRVCNCPLPPSLQYDCDCLNTCRLERAST